MNMRKKYGPFTITEWTIASIFIAVVGAFIIALANSPAPAGYVSPVSNITYGINGMTETRCINGFKFIVGEQGRVQQMLNETGGGIKCEN